MCILCVIQKWSRRIATMLPWLVIPLIGLWALSQLLPPAFRFEITSPRLACVFVLLVTLFWYEILMPQLSAWRVRRNARLREKKRFEAIELQKLRKTATRRCRNCLTPYREQNPGGGKFMCSYCGHVSKRPVLDLPVPGGLGISNNGILKDLVGKSGRMLNEKVWSDSGGWMCGQDWLDNGNWVGGSFPGKGRRKHGGLGFFGDDHCLAEKSYSHALIFACRALTAFFLSIMWVWRKIFRVSTSGDDALVDAERRKMAKRGENGANFQESRVEKARRKAEEKRQAKLTKEQWEEEERKQREEVARLVEERRRSRDEKTEADKEGRKGSTPKEKVTRKVTENKRQERKSERDRGSSKSNSDAEELEKRAGRDSEKNRKCESDRRSHQRSMVHTAKSFNNDINRGALTNNYSREAVGTKNLDNRNGTFLYPSRAVGGNSFGKATINSVAGTRENKSNGHADRCQISVNRRETSQPERSMPKSNGSSEDKNASRPVLVEPQPYEAPKNPWLTRSATVPAPSDPAVISKPNGKSQSEVTSPSYKNCLATTRQYDNPINFGLPSPFPLSTNSCGSMSSSIGIQMSADSKLPLVGEAHAKYLPEESDIFEDPCYVPDPVFLLGPVSESLDNFQLDLGFVTDMELEEPCPIRSMPISSEAIRPSPIESPLSRLRLHDERNTSPPFLTTPKAQDVQNTPINGSCNGNENGTWQMWNTSPLGQDGGLLGVGASWLLSPDSNRSNKENVASPMHQKTMASLFKSDEQIRSGTPPKFLPGSYHNSISGCTDDPWLPETLFGLTLGREDNFSMNTKEGIVHNEPICKSPNGSAPNHPFELSLADRWRKVDWTVQGAGVSTSNNSSVVPRSPVGGVDSSFDVQSIWSYD